MLDFFSTIILIIQLHILWILKNKLFYPLKDFLKFEGIPFLLQYSKFNNICWPSHILFYLSCIQLSIIEKFEQAKKYLLNFPFF